MEFTVAFATDLASDFQSYFYKMFGTLKTLLVTKNLELMESVFTCASQLVKLNSKFLISDLSSVIPVFVDLVRTYKVYYL